jgi:hypothetical protein
MKISVLSVQQHLHPFQQLQSIFNLRILKYQELEVPATYGKRNSKQQFLR